MFNHAPHDYKCPICLAVDGIESKDTMMKQDDILYRDNLVMAVVNSKFITGNEGHVIVVPKKHYENFYDLPDEVGEKIIKIAKRVAIAMKEIRGCDGIMIQQNNEPASGQHALHYHMHIFPRFNNDNIWLKMKDAYVANPSERHKYSDPLKQYFRKIKG